MTEYKQVECPRCNGKGGSIGIACGEGGCQPVTFKCDLCEGTGLVYPYKLEYVERGEKMRAARLAAGRTLSQQASRRGIEVVDISRMERGVTPPISGDSKIRFPTRLIIRIKKNWERYKREGFVLAQAEFEEWEYEIDGRQSTHGPWYGRWPMVTLIEVRILDEDGNQRRWPKAHGPYPCTKCHGLGYSKFAPDGSPAPDSVPCDACGGRCFRPGPGEKGLTGVGSLE